MKAVIAAIYFRFPARKLKVIGVTGTNGKTTTCNVLAHLLSETGSKVGMMTTIRFRIGDRVWDNKLKMSSQSPWLMQKLLRQMVNEDCEYAIVEVTSHAVHQHRIWGINFDVGVYTNISDDHLEYHGNFNNYLRTKAAFLKSIQGMRRKLGLDKVLVINADDQQFDYMNQAQADRVYTYGLKNGVIKGENLNLKARETSFDVKAPNAEFTIKDRLIGDFNVYNSLAVVSVMLALGYSPEQIVDGFATLDPIPGRYEPIEVGQDFTVIVDYAHTEDALEKLCSIFKGLTKGKLILVFGCTGGGRDKAKRPKMGAIADNLADLVVLTNDDPYEEDELGILNDIAAGINRKEGENLYKIVDRRSAIELALTKAEPGDTVLIAGKGSEQVIVIGTEFLPWDDREVVREVLQKEYVVNL